MVYPYDGNASRQAAQWGADTGVAPVGRLAHNMPTSDVPMHPPTSANGKIPPPARGHIVITGASTGIGRSCALQLAWNGFTVWAGIRTAAEANALEHAALGTPIPIRTIPLDVTDSESVRTAADTIRSAAGNDGLRGLVNNAGVCVVGPVECIPLDDWRHQFEVNLLGAIAVTQVMLPLLRVHAAGRQRPMRYLGLANR